MEKTCEPLRKEVSRDGKAKEKKDRWARDGKRGGSGRAEWGQSWAWWLGVGKGCVGVGAASGKGFGLRLGGGGRGRPDSSDS